jgi:hypothetical protein
VGEASPSTNGPANGRGANGQFLPGGPGGPGNPHAAEVGKHRARFFAALRDNDVARALKVIRSLMSNKNAKDADRLAAAREILDRVIGKSVQSDLLERIEAIEAKIEKEEESE